MIKRFLILTCAFMLCITGYSQEKCEGNGPKKGDVTMAATIGYNTYVGKNAVSGNFKDYEISALSTDWFDTKLMVGIDGSWFFSNKWSLRFGGSLGFTNNPGYTSVPGTIDENTTNGDGSVPNYRAVASGQTLKYSVFTGIDRYFQHKSLRNLYFHLGVHGGFAYGLNEIKYDEETAMGKSIGEAFNIKGAINFGVDYYFLPAMFIGIEINPFQYTYNTTTIKPQEGLKNLSANSHNYGFLAAPTLKIGFKF